MANTDESICMRSLQPLPQQCFGTPLGSPVFLGNIWMCHLAVHTSWCSGELVLSAGFSLKEDTISGNLHRNIQDGC